MHEIADRRIKTRQPVLIFPAS